MARPTFWKVLAGSAAIVAFAGHATAADINLGMVASITGPASFIGAPLVNGMKLAIDELNAKQFFGPGNTLKVAIEDDATDKNQSLALVNRFAADANILAVMGPTSGVTAVPAAQLANEKKLPLWTGANNLEILKTGPWSFTNTEPAVVSIPNFGAYAVEKLKVKSCAIVTVQDSEAYVALAKAFSDYLASRGVKVGELIGVKMSDTNFSAISVKLAAQNPECVFISSPAVTGANIITQLKQAGLDPATQVMGHNGFASDDLIRTGGGAVEGTYLFASWVPGGANDLGRAFAKAFRERYNREADNWAAIGYTIMNVVATGVKNAGPNPTRESVLKGLTELKDVPVVIGSGFYNRDENRYPRYKENVMVVKGGKFVPAP